MNFLRRRRSSEDDGEDAFTESNIHKSRKPPNTAFRQQRLKAWQPILTPKSVIPLLFLLALIFAPLGIAIIHTTYNVEMLSLDYSHCDTLATGTFEAVPNKYIDYHFKKKNDNPKFEWKLLSDTETPTCQVHFTLPKNIDPPLYLYYRLTNFFQNHRKFVDSYDLDQIKGKAVSLDSLTDKCDPLKEFDGKIIYPCGLIANSIFNDTFTNPILLNPTNGEVNETYIFSDDDISWSSDRNTRFKKTNYKAEEIVPPPNWAKKYPDGYTEDSIPDLSQMQHLQNWMRTAALPSFYKLYGKNTETVLNSGIYQIDIELNYPVTIFGGSKSIVITTNSIFGARNISLGLIYLVVAIICLVAGIAFLLQHLIKPRKIGDHNYLQNQIGPTIRDQL